ncbi:hypothetical protein Hanom_Chr07g00620491 [Helianthus anomalus]
MFKMDFRTWRQFLHILLRRISTIHFYHENNHSSEPFFFRAKISNDSIPTSRIQYRCSNEGPIKRVLPCLIENQSSGYRPTRHFQHILTKL